MSRNDTPHLRTSTCHDSRTTSVNSDSGCTSAHLSPEVAPAAKKRTCEKWLQIRTVNLPPRESSASVPPFSHVLYPQCGMTILEESWLDSFIQRWNGSLLGRPRQLGSGWYVLVLQQAHQTCLHGKSKGVRTNFEIQKISADFISALTNSSVSPH